MNICFRFFYVMLLLGMLGCGANSKSKVGTNVQQHQPEDDYTVKLDSLLETKDPRTFNGVVLITQNGKTEYSKARGFSNFETKSPITLNDNFRIQSNSKQITAALILREVEKGTIDLSETISVYLPDFKQAWANTVTIHQLLNMSAGVVDLEMPLAFEPGTGFRYSNPAYDLLGRIIEKTTEKSYSEVANSLFKELGMENTYCYAFSGFNPNLVNGYWVSNGKTELVDFKSMNFTEDTWANFVPAGGIISNAIDLNIWDTKLHSGKIVHSDSYKKMVNSTVVDQDYTFSDVPSNYGYGVNIHEGDPSKYIGHAGRGIGFVNLKFYVPDKNLDVIILENVYNQDMEVVYYFESKIRELIMNSNLVN